MSDKLVVIYTPFASDWHSPLEEVGSKEVRWKYFSDQNRPFWQRILKRPNFNTAFAGLRAVLYVKRHNARLLVTIGPRRPENIAGLELPPHVHVLRNTARPPRVGPPRLFPLYTHRLGKRGRRVSAFMAAQSY